jgi:uncharacterized protein (DUF2235 family)
MSKRLVVCCDGTWETANVRELTNVAKIALAIAPEDPAGVEQRTYYQPGVGTRWFDRYTGAIFGLGVGQAVRDAYRYIVQNFEPGDELFLYGFSRGAFTARSLAGFIRNSGVLRREHIDRLDEAYALYRSRKDTAHPRSVEAQLFRRAYSHETRIRFIGVWDTVGALGIPLTGLPLVDLINDQWRFHDTDLSSTVDAAFHALAIDEHASLFRPTLWTPQQHAPEHQRVEQVWFAGSHGDVGGGLRGHGLSDVALAWMVERSREYGLAFSPEDAAASEKSGAEKSGAEGSDAATDISPNPFGLLQLCHTGIFGLLPQRYVRPLGAVDAAHEYLASTAQERHRYLPDYAPSNLVAYLERGAREVPVLPTTRARLVRGLVADRSGS